MEEIQKSTLEYVNLVIQMRTAQKEYFSARRRHDAVSASVFLGKSVSLEKQVDEAGKQLEEKIKYGQQPSLF